MSSKGIFSKRLTGIICDSPNLTINQIKRWIVQETINIWEHKPSPTITVIPAKEKAILIISYYNRDGVDHSEITTVDYTNIVNFPDFIESLVF